MQIVEATMNDDDTLASHYLALWESYGTPKEHFASDARAQTIAFLREGRQHRGLNAFLALIDNNIAGSAACQLHISPYPEVIKPAHRRFGYIWSVYVEPQYRKRGIAQQLMDRAVNHLRSLGCTTVVLHSSDAGETLYKKLGFEPAKEMRLKLS
jgi:ribosomal protein S18 acetylase RimI-like enzyme